MNTITIFFLVANWIVAICSLCALKQTRAFKREEKYSKRAFIAPCPDPGLFEYCGSSEEKLEKGGSSLTIKMKNYGINPAEKIKSDIVGFNVCDVNGTNKDGDPVFNLTYYSNNPVPNTAEYKIYITEENFEDQEVDPFSVLIGNFLSIKVRYWDRILKREFEDVFYWRVGEGGRFIEVSEEYILKLRNLSGKFFKI